MTENAEIIRGNARINAWSTLMMNLGTALAAAVGYRIFVEQTADLTTALWILGTAFFISVSQMVLALLEAES